MMLPTFRLSDSAIGTAKWLAFILMLGDHANKYLLNLSVDYLFYAGRISAPLFIIVFSYNLSRTNDDAKKILKLAGKLFIFGLLSTPFFIMLGLLPFGWLPLNILFLFGILATIVYLERSISGFALKWLFVVIAVLIGGALVEFWWPGVVLGLGVYHYFKKPNFFAFALVILALFGFCFINGNLFGLLVIPILMLLHFFPVELPRYKTFFYWAYPVHLCLIWIARIPLVRSGHVVF